MHIKTLGLQGGARLKFLMKRGGGGHYNITGTIYLIPPAPPLTP